MGVVLDYCDDLVFCLLGFFWFCLCWAFGLFFFVLLCFVYKIWFLAVLGMDILFL